MCIYVCVCVYVYIYVYIPIDRYIYLNHFAVYLKLTLYYKSTILQLKKKKKVGIQQEVKDVRMFYQFEYSATILLRIARISPKSN